MVLLIADVPLKLSPALVPATVFSCASETTPAVKGTRTVPDYQAIDQSKLVPLLCKTILELEARITAIEAN